MAARSGALGRRRTQGRRPGLALVSRRRMGEAVRGSEVSRRRMGDAGAAASSGRSVGGCGRSTPARVAAVAGEREGGGGVSPAVAGGWRRGCKEDWARLATRLGETRKKGQRGQMGPSRRASPIARVPGP